MIHVGATIRGINGWCTRRFAVVDHGRCMYAGWQRGEGGYWHNPNALEGGIDFAVPEDIQDAQRIANDILDRCMDEIRETIAQDLIAGMAQTYGLDLEVATAPTQDTTSDDDVTAELAEIRGIKAAAAKGRVAHAAGQAMMLIALAAPEPFRHELRIAQGDRIVTLTGNGGIPKEAEA